MWVVAVLGGLLALVTRTDQGIDRKALCNEPMSIARILPIVSLLERTGPDDWRFRLVGTEIERRWGRKITGSDLVSGFCKSRRQTSSPFMSGRMKSSFANRSGGRFVGAPS